MKQSIKIGIHIGFWVLFTILPPFFYAFLRHPNDLNRLYMLLLDFGINFVCFYIAYFTFVPYFLKSQAKWKWVLLTVIFAMIYGWISSSIVLSVANTLEIRYFKRFTPTSQFLREFIGTFLFIAYAGFIKVTESWIVDQRLKNELIRQNQAGELALLKSQVSPHFLFNTLNNIYSLVYKKADQAPSAVMKLSEIMRYMLYEASTEKVQLEKEIEYLKSYIELQSIRLKQPDFVSFAINGTIENRQIAPMLLIPFVENAFKHCDKKAHPPGIVIDLHISKAELQFMVKNKVPMDKQNHSGIEGGIGLSNVKRRLMLIYPSMHQLTIDENKTEFEVTLTIYESK